MNCGYNPNRSLINKFTFDISKALDFHISNNYDNFLIIEDLNSQIIERLMNEFCSSYSLQRVCCKL